MVKFKLRIDAHYRSWSFSKWSEERDDVAAGRIPLDSWAGGGSGAATKIASGSLDAAIKSEAIAMKALGGPVLLRFNPEMDCPCHSIGSPSAFVAAWRRIYRIFQAQGATNVKFVWDPTVTGYVTGRAIPYYPGNSYVNWIGADGYNRYTTTHIWKSFGQIFAPLYTWGSAHGKPMIVCESGTTEDPKSSGRKATWFTDAAAWIKAHPNLKAWVYNSTITTNGYDYRVETSASALTAYTNSGKLAYFIH